MTNRTATMTLIQMQDEALRQMNEPRTSEKRARKHRAAVLRAYRAKAVAMGFTAAEAAQQSSDVYDVFKLNEAADAAGESED